MKAYCGQCQHFKDDVGTYDFDRGHIYECCNAPRRTIRVENYRGVREMWAGNTPHLKNEKNDCPDFVQLDD